MAGNSERIDDVIDPVALKQVDDLTKAVTDLEASFVATARAAIQLNNATGNSRSFRDYNTNATAAATQTAKLQQAQTNAARSAVLLQQAQQRLATQTANAANAQARAAATQARALSPYQQLSKELERQRLAAKDLAVTYGEQSPQFLAAAQSVQQLDTRLRAIDQTLGQSQRNVGNYASALAGVQRAYGLVRIAANILPGVGISGIFLGAFEGLKFLGEKLGIFGGQVEEVNKKLKEVTEAANQNAAQDLTKLDSLYDAATNVNLAQSERLTAVKELQKEYPAYFGNLSKEAILAGQAASAYDNLSNSIINQAIIKAGQEKVTEAVKPLVDLITEQRKLQAEIDKNNTANQKKNPSKITSFDVIDSNNKPVPGLRQVSVSGARNAVLNSFIDDETTAAKKAGTNGVQTVQDYKKRLTDAIKDARDGVQQLIQSFGINSLIDPDKGIKKPKKQADDRKQILNEQLKAQRDADDKVQSDETKSFDDRYAKAKEFEDNSLKLIKDAESAKVITQLQALNLRSDVEKKYNADLFKINADAQKELKAIYEADAKTRKETQDGIVKNSIDVETQFTNQRKKRIADNANDALIGLSQQFAGGKINKNQFDTQKSDIEGQSKVDQDQADIDGIKLRISIQNELIASGIGDQKKLQEDLQKDKDKLADAERKRDKDVADNAIAQAQRVLDEKKKIAQAEKQLGDAVGDFLKTLVDARYTNELNQIQERKDALTDQTKAQIDAENKSLDNSATKADKIAVINARAAAQQAQLDAQQRKIKHDQAVADRAFAIDKIIENTAIGATAAFPNIFLEGLIIALGAVQLATVLATPIPKYEKGTKNAKGGISLVGEAGTEYVITPGGEGFFTPDKHTLMDIPKGSQVISNAELMGITANPNKMPPAGASQTSWSKVVDAINSQGKKTQQALLGQKKSITKANGWMNEMSKAQSHQAYRNRRLN